MLPFGLGNAGPPYWPKFIAARSRAWCGVFLVILIVYAGTFTFLSIVGHLCGVPFK